MDSRKPAEQYEDALVEERLLWRQLHEPITDTTEQVKAFAAWSAAAERARSIADRTQAPAGTGRR